MTARDRYLDRLSKLLALESSPNVHEAAAARRAAESLMARHGLRREEASGRSPSGYYEHPMGARGWTKAWRFALVTSAARHCGADVVGLWAAGRRKVRVVGVRSDVERAVALYGELLAVVMSLGRDDVVIDEDMEEELRYYGADICTDAFRRGEAMGVITLLTIAGGAALFRDFSPEARPGDGPGLVLAWRGGASDRARARYEPEETSIALDDVEPMEWFQAGVRAVRDNVVADSAGVRIRDRDK